MRHHFRSGDRTVELPVSLDHIAVRFDDSLSSADRASATRKAGLGSMHARVELPDEKYTIFKVAPVAEPRDSRHQRAMEATSAHPGVARVSHVYGTTRARVVATDRIALGLKPGRNVIRKITRDHHLKVVEHDGDEYLLSIPVGQDPLALSLELADLDAVSFAEPDFVTFGERIKHATAAVSHRKKPDLYPLRLTRTLEAWKLQRGDPSIRIAIVDEGVETQHETLRAAIAGTYDATRHEADQEPEGCDWHGTACAGLALGNEAPGGTPLGIGVGCSMLAVRLGYSRAMGDGAGDRRFVTKSWWIKRAIDWAWRNGADVISNSWSGGTESALITEAFARAAHEGRGGKGCVIVVSAGNDDGPVEFPGNTKNALTVSASNRYDEPKTPQSRDNERWWGSNYGPEVDIAAPGVATFTADNVGEPGFGPTSWCNDFSGTSAATPIVAGAAALVLSANPELTGKQVAKILCDTADKVGSFDYHDGRNDRMGSGRVNVLAAVTAARAAAKPVAAKTAARKKQPARKRGTKRVVSRKR